jgi:hypothetical protein
MNCKIWELDTRNGSNTWGMHPSSRRSGPRMKPPPDPRRPPTVPPSRPQKAQNMSCAGDHSIEASQTHSKLPFMRRARLSLHSSMAFHRNTLTAAGIYINWYTWYEKEVAQCAIELKVWRKLSGAQKVADEWSKSLGLPKRFVKFRKDKWISMTIIFSQTRTELRMTRFLWQLKRKG